MQHDVTAGVDAGEYPTHGVDEAGGWQLVGRHVGCHGSLLEVQVRGVHQDEGLA